MDLYPLSLLPSTHLTPSLLSHCLSPHPSPSLPLFSHTASPLTPHPHSLFSLTLPPHPSLLPLTPSLLSHYPPHSLSSLHTASPLPLTPSLLSHCLSPHSLPSLSLLPHSSPSYPVLAEDAIRAALKDYKTKKTKAAESNAAVAM